MPDTSKFEDVPWCAALLAAPNTVTFQPASHLAKTGTQSQGPVSQDQLFARTLLSDDAVPRCIGFYQAPTELPSSSSASSSWSAESGSPPPPPFLFRSASLLFDLRPGVNGFNGTVHGGLIGALIDESMGSFLFANDQVFRRKKAEGALPPGFDELGSDKLGFVTGRMDMRMKRPIPTPSVVVVTSELAKVEGRKVHIRVLVKGEKGEEFATCDGTWLSFMLGKL